MRSKKPVENICIVCLKDFQSWRSDAKTCSPACRQALARSPDGHMARLKKIEQSLKQQISEFIEESHQLLLVDLVQLLEIERDDLNKSRPKRSGQQQ